MEPQKTQLDPYALHEDTCAYFCVPSPSSIRTGLSNLIERIRDVVSKVLQCVVYYCFYLPKEALANLKKKTIEIFKGYLLDRLDNNPSPETYRLITLTLIIAGFFRFCKKKKEEDQTPSQAQRQTILS